MNSNWRETVSRPTPYTRTEMRVPVAEFASKVRGADHEVDLFGAAMVIAGLGGRTPDEHAVAATLDGFGEAVRARAGENAGTLSLIEAIDHELFAVGGFHGNTDAYGDAENSYLDKVVERRTGIPITLSLVYMEVAQRVGLRCDGVGYPGHFIVRCGEPGEDAVYLDPFQQGARLDQGELIATLRGLDLKGATPESFLCAVTRRQILTRMLNNLRGVYREAKDMERWHASVELALVLEPWNIALTGERGMLSYRLGDTAGALIDLERYVEATGRPRVSAGALRLLDELRAHEHGKEESR